MIQQSVVTYVFLNTQLLELDKFGASGLQVEPASGFVGDALLAGTHDERHEGGRLDLRTAKNNENRRIILKPEVYSN